MDDLLDSLGNPLSEHPVPTPTPHPPPHAGPLVYGPGGPGHHGGGDAGGGPSQHGGAGGGGGFGDGFGAGAAGDGTGAGAGPSTATHHDPLMTVDAGGGANSGGGGAAPSSGNAGGGGGGGARAPSSTGEGSSDGGGVVHIAGSKALPPPDHGAAGAAPHAAHLDGDGGGARERFCRDSVFQSSREVGDAIAMVLESEMDADGVLHDIPEECASAPVDTRPNAAFWVAPCLFASSAGTVLPAYLCCRPA